MCENPAAGVEVCALFVVSLDVEMKFHGKYPTKHSFVDGVFRYHRSEDVLDGPTDQVVTVPADKLVTYYHATKRFASMVYGVF